MTVVRSIRLQRQIGWMLAATFALAGYSGIVAPRERRLQALESRTHDLYRLANHNERMLANSAGLIAARERVARDVTHLGRQRGPGSSALRMLRLLQREAQRNHVVVTGLAPDESEASMRATGLENVTIALRGTYRNVLEAIADLSKGDVLIELSDAELAAAPDEFGAPEVAATIHATIYRRPEAITKERDDARVAPG